MGLDRGPRSQGELAQGQPQPLGPPQSASDVKSLVCATFLPLLWLPCPPLWLQFQVLCPDSYPVTSALLRPAAQSVKIKLTPNWLSLEST